MNVSTCITRSIAFLLVLTVSPTVLAGQTGAAPVPPQISDAHTIFLSNAGGDSYFALAYSDGPDRAYNDLYAALKGWGRYQIVTSPNDADLILEVHSLAKSSTDVTNGNSSTVYTPELRLELRDPKTRTVLWTLSSYVKTSAGRQKARDKQLDAAATVLFNQLRQLTGETLTPAEAKAAHSRPGLTRGTWILLGSVAAIGIIVPVAIIASHSQPSQPKLPTCANPPFCTIP